MIQNNTITADSFQPYFTTQMKPLFEQNADQWKAMKSLCSKQTLTSVGLEQINTNSNIGFQLAGGIDPIVFPQGSIIKADRYKVWPVIQAYTMQINGMTFKDLNSGHPSMESTNSVQDQMQYLMEEYYKNQERFLAGNGSGTLAVLDAGSTTTVLRVRKAASAINGSGFGANRLKAQLASGQAVAYDLIDPAASTPLVAAGLTIASIAYGTAYDSVTINSTLGGAPATGLLLVYTGMYKFAPYGFDYLVGSKKTGVWQGLDVTSQIQHQSAVIDGAGAVFDEFALETLLQTQAHVNGGGVNPTYRILAAPNIVSRWRVNGMARINYIGAPDAQNLGIKKAGYQDSIFVEWPACDPGSFYAGDFKDIVWGTQEDLSPVTGVDNRMWKQSTAGANNTGTDAYYAQFRSSHNFLNSNPRTWIGGKNFDGTGVSYGTVANYLV